MFKKEALLKISKEQFHIRYEANSKPQFIQNPDKSNSRAKNKKSSTKEMESIQQKSSNVKIDSKEEIKKPKITVDSFGEENNDARKDTKHFKNEGKDDNIEDEETKDADNFLDLLDSQQLFIAKPK